MSTVGILFASAAWRVPAGRKRGPRLGLGLRTELLSSRSLRAEIPLAIAFVGLALLFRLGQSSVRVSMSEAAGTILHFLRFARQIAVAVVPDPGNSGLPQAAKTVTREGHPLHVSLFL